MISKNLSSFSTHLFRKIHCASTLAVFLMEGLTQCSVLAKPIRFTVSTIHRFYPGNTIKTNPDAFITAL